MTINGGRAVVQTLVKEGVSHVFGIPGVHNLPIYDALYDSQYIRHILVRQEQGAGFMADGYARASGKPGVCLLASGPGSTNAITALSEAFLDSSPVVVIAAGIPRRFRGKDSLHEIDHWTMYGTITKWHERVAAPENISLAVKRALCEAVSGRPRPTYVEIPYDVLLAPIAAEASNGISFSPPIVLDETIAEAADLLASGRRPVIIAGGGVMSGNALEEIARLSEILAAPVATTMMGRGVFPEDHPLAAGFVQDIVASTMIRDADIVYAAGCRFGDSSFWGGKAGPLPIPGRMIHVDIDKGEIGKIYPVFLGIVGDAKNVTGRICHQLEKNLRLQKRDPNVAVRILEGLRREKESKLTSIDRQVTPLKPAVVMKELVAAAPKDAIFTCDSGNNTWWIHLFCKVVKPRSLLSPAGNWAMGFAFPAAMGAKVACPERVAISVIGDGGFLMTCQELATATANDIGVIVVILNNGVYGAIENYQKYVYDERFIAIDIQKPDFAKLAESFGAKGVTIERPGELTEALQNFTDASKPVVLDVKIDPKEEIPTWLIDRFYKS